MATDQLNEVRQMAEKSLKFFATLVNPHRVYGDVHYELFDFWNNKIGAESDNTIALIPRDHQKSHAAAVKAAWLLTRDPSKTILYVSATSGLAEKQLKAIKDILLSDTYRRYWPDMVHRDEGKREKWTNTEISLDHPRRKKESIRDSSVFAAGLTTNITGFHATDVFLDDIVVPSNAYTEEGREQVRRQYSQLASIETTGASETIVGTKYHPNDIYTDVMSMKEPIFDEDMEIVGQRDVYDTFIRVVETNGEFLWPKKFRASDGKPFGFDARELARKKAKYLDVSQYYAQYYQETNHSDQNRLSWDNFQYYDKGKLVNEEGDWKYQGKKLNVYAAIDFAFSLSKQADFSAIAVIGINEDGHIYILDLDRFKADRVGEYFSHIMEMYSKWEFRKLSAETTVAQSIIVNELKELLVKSGARFSILQTKPMKDKQERISAILEHRYENLSMFHYKGGHTSMLEEELVKTRPAHDDLKDALSSAVDIAVAPIRSRYMEREDNIIYHSRFGGVA